MPTYVYRREDGTTFELFQRISDDALTHDPETGQAVERVIGGGAGLIFKGTGFYETDYVKKSGGQDKSANTAAPDTTKSATPASSDSQATSSNASD